MTVTSGHVEAPWCLATRRPRPATDTPAALDTPPDVTADDAGDPCEGRCVGTSTPTCDASASPPTCVECVVPTDCADRRRPRCDVATHACAPCETGGDCDAALGFDGNVCDHDFPGADDAVCVICVPGDEVACGGNVCDAMTRQCSDRPAGSAELCEPCLSDRHCGPGMLCVGFPVLDRVAGRPPFDSSPHCVWREDATGPGAPNGACAGARPYAIATEVTTLSGTTASVCLLDGNSCEALADMTAGCVCGDDGACGLSIGEFPRTDILDGYCRTIAGSLEYHCTLPCTTDLDCPETSGCETTAGPAYCRL